MSAVNNNWHFGWAYCLHLQGLKLLDPGDGDTTFRRNCNGLPVDVGLRAVEASWNVMAHAQKPDFFFRRNGRVHLNRRGRQFSRLLAAELCASTVVMLDTPCSEVVWRVLATHSIRQFPLHFPSRASPCAITFQLESICIVFTVLVLWTSVQTFHISAIWCPT